MSYEAQQREAEKMIADAILCERTCAMLERRFGNTGFVPAARAYLSNVAIGLRDTATNKIPLRTKTGRLITDAEIDEWAAEAETGYDVSEIIRRSV